ncbi:MAG: glycosyltransferase [Calditrichaeota bacterium]|nr:MAG: glycosyltransferase [Calditrichota bacterium]
MKHYSFYSVIVPTYNRKEEIAELLESFLSLKFPHDRFELIIADDGSTDGTAELVQSFTERHSLDVKFYSQENRGPGAARNMAMEKARGDFLIFVDSDCTVDPLWLQRIDEALHREQADAFGGPDSYREDFPPLLKAINYSMTSFITTGGIRGHKRKRLGKFYPRSFNMGLSREVYQKVGGFGSLRHGQDIEFSHRILESGAKVILIPDAYVYHKRRTSLKKFFRQVFNWGVARINLYKIDKKMLEPVHTLPAVATLIALLTSLLAVFFTPIRYLFLGGLLLWLILTLLSALHAAWQYRHPAMLVLVPVTMTIQILGYGLGFLTAFVYRVIFNKGEFTGFRKKYYQ